MEFSFTQEQMLIRDMASTFLADISPISAVRDAMASESGMQAEIWPQICQQMGWQALVIPECYGGLALGWVELASVLEQMGKTLLCAPFFSTAVLATNALLHCASESAKQRYLPAIAAGELTATLGWLSADAPTNRQWDHHAVQAIATPTTDGYSLSGNWQQVIDGDSAQLLILAARDPQHKLLLFALPGDTPGLSRRFIPALDQTRRSANIRCEQLQLTPDTLISVVDQQALLTGFDRVLALAAIALAAEQTGGARQIMQMAVDYSQTRQQFGQPIAAFQALKHRAADMMLEVESATSALYYAACCADDALLQPDDATLHTQLTQAAALAQAQCSPTFFHCAAEALQFHGGVGFTWEYDVHLYFKRAKASQLLLGDAPLHLERIAQQLLDDSPATLFAAMASSDTSLTATLHTAQDPAPSTPQDHSARSQK